MSEEVHNKRLWKPFLLGCFCGIAFTILTFLLMIAFTAHSLKFWLARRETSSLKAPPILGSEVFDYTLQGINMEGDEVSFEIYKNKPVFIFVWDTECIHCLSTLTTVQKLYDELKNFQIPVLSLTDSKENDIQKVYREFNCTIPTIRIKGEFIKNLCGEKIPCGLIVNSKGEIAYRYTGSTNWNSPEVIQYLVNLSGKQ